jgi:hypothetical protein
LQNEAAKTFIPNTSMIFRVNDDGSVPADNPFPANAMMPGIEKIFAYGIRNSFGLAFDTHPMSGGALWDSENGEDFYDEINRVDAGFNSGWLKVMGPASRTPGFNPATDLFIVTGSQYADPAFSWKNGVGVTALAFLNSTQIGPQYEHDLFVADFNNGNIYRFELNGLRDALVLPGTVGDKVADTNAEFKSLLFGTGFNGITDLKVGPDGLLYVLSIGTGKIYVIEPAPGPLKITSKPFPKDEQNVAYSVTITASGGTGTRTFSLFSGVLPTGLNLVGDAISGTPTVVGNFPITIQVTDGAAASVRKNFKITILPAVVVTTTTLKDGKLNKKYNVLLKATGGKKPFTWVLDAGSPLPPPTGLNVDPKGKVTGIPTATGGPVTFRVRVTDILGGTDTQDLDLTIQP